MADTNRDGVLSREELRIALYSYGIRLSKDESEIVTSVADTDKSGAKMLSEGKVLIGVVPQKAEEVLTTLRATKVGKDAQIIGEATGNFGEVVLETVVGGKRIITPPVGDPIPRIC